ncbi:TonB-dependent receptor [Allorhizobium borbori]|uniref:Iron complex outermembrane receptor protein n=1 Tax=Allorhizobium borbori TaxID=485907 RepID=A0A7W6K0V6_9HYPH|nr:TonB-dependent siderophore receptor [Allorhizobium borbori]MBB4103091.1 iron complex outermembrane receptor protein [Allorhizobium borbori]
MIRTRFKAFTTLPLLMATAPALAEDTADTTLETIVVQSGQAGVPAPNKTSRLLPAAPGGQVATGSGLGVLGNRDAMSTPFNVTAYTARLIADTQARSIADVAASDPSVRAIFPRSSYRDVYSIRGFNLFSYNMGFDGLYGIAPKQRYPAEFAERVEILKGPDTFVNGISLGGSIGGAINIVPKRAGNEPVTSITTSYVSDGEFATHLDYSRRYGDNKEFGMRFNGLVRGGDLAVDDVSERLGAAALSLDYEGEGFRLYGDFGLQSQKIDSPDWSATLANGVTDIPRPSSTVSLTQPWSWVRTKDAYGTIRAEYDLADDWTVFGAFGISGTETTGIYVQPTNLKTNGDYTGNAYSFPSNGIHYSAQAGIRGRAETGPVEHNLTLALARWNQNLKATRTTLGSFSSNIFNPVTVATPSLAGIVDLDDIHRTAAHRYTSLALADTMSMADDRVLLTLGARWQKVENTNYAAATGLVTSAYDDQKISPAAGLVIKPFENVSLYANYVEALQQGSTAPSTAANAGEVFAPVVARQIEAGVKLDLGPWTASLGAFRITQPNSLTDPVSNVFSYDGEQRNQSVEFNVSGEPIDGVRILGGIMLIDGRQTKTQNGANDDRKAIGVPDYQINAGLEWDTPFIEKLTLSARVINTGRQFVNATNTQEIDGWTRVDVGARYVHERDNGKPITLRAGVENLFDRDYWASAASGQASGIARGAPRTFLVSTTFEF